MQKKATNLIAIYNATDMDAIINGKGQGEAQKKDANPVAAYNVTDLDAIIDAKDQEEAHKKVKNLVTLSSRFFLTLP